MFARVSPKQKLDLVNGLQEDHHIVAMTGDGVNDAPALKKADIGIAMGIRGTQVSQEVADMVLKDDAFESIVLAVRQGRVIFTNIRRFIIFLLSCNLSELLVIGLVATFNIPFQLVAIQILFINLITDVFPAMALGFTEGDETVMQKPRAIRASLFSAATAGPGSGSMPRSSEVARLALPLRRSISARAIQTSWQRITFFSIP